MNRSVLCLLFCLISLAGFSQDATYDVRRVRWGMTPAEVKASESEKPDGESPDGVSYSEVEIGRFRADVVYTFQNGQLYSTIITLKRQSFTSDQKVAYADYQAFTESLALKYGKGKSSFGVGGRTTWDLERTFVTAFFTGLDHERKYIVEYLAKVPLKYKAIDPSDI